MKLRDMRTGTRLSIGVGAILALVASLAAMGWVHADQLWLQTKGLYEHPLTVSRALGELSVDILSIHRDMKDLIQTESESEGLAYLQSIDVHEANALREFDILLDSYLGPRSNVEEALVSFVEWKAIRDETIRLLEMGNVDEAASRTKADGVGGAQVSEIWDRVERISDFAINKSDELYRNADETQHSFRLQLGIGAIAVLLLSLLISWHLLQSIRVPIEELSTAAKRFHGGDLDARSRYISSNEFGALSDTFNVLAATVQSELQSRDASALIAGALLREEELRGFCRELLKALMENTRSQIGAVYLLNDQGTAFDHFESIGLASPGRTSFSATELEGEFGAALATGQIQRLTDIPPDARFTFGTVGGELPPREIITIPIPGDQGIAAVVSLAGVRSYPASAVQLVNDVWQVTTARLNGVLATGKIRTFAGRIERQNEELHAQQEELRTQTAVLRRQTEELQEQNVELERQRQSVEEANRLKSQFLSNMSHELRTPLNSIMALSRVLMMQAGTKLSEEEVNYLAIVERNGKNLLTLINDILDLSKIEAGRMDISPRPFSLGQTVKSIVESIVPLAAEKRLEIRQDIPEDLPPVESDEIRVTQILQNLLSNAVKFTDAGYVSVSLQASERTVLVRITDTGIGIAKDDLLRIFEEFRQLDGTTARRYEGTGLGLTIARKAARLLGGEIRVESELGKGSTFTLTLPLTWPGTTPVCEPIVGSLPSSLKSAQRTVLVVDDEPETVAMIARYLLQEGYDTVTATSGAEALTLAARVVPFAVTLDILMPDMDGWEVLQSLKRNPETKDIPVIVVSVTENRETGFALGAFGYVTKPISKQGLISAIRKVAKRRTRMIMIVDDDDLDRRQIGRIVEEEGLTAIVAEDGAACLALLKTHVPDVLVLDLMMPGLDGFAVLESIRGNPEIRDLPVIIVTAKDLTAADRSRLSGNVASVLDKSAATSESLLAEIKRILTDLEPPVQGVGSGESPTPPLILLVEDNEAATIQVKAVLEAAGLSVAVARGGQEAIDYVSHTVPDGIILDLMMPNIDGFAVLERIRGTQATQRIPVLILTAKDLTPEDLRRLSANHIQQLVHKGDVDREGLLSKIRAMLESAPGARGRRDDDEGTEKRACRDESDIRPTPPTHKGVVRGDGRETAPRASILIVEDNPDNMTTIKAVLQDRYRVLEATDGEAGLRMAEEVRPDLILLDMALPKMDGLEVVRHLKEIKELSAVPVIAMTARVMKGDREEILEAGCDDYVAKPIDPADCLKKIKALLKGQDT
jgi:CheY-like chemotaxis protein/signal transduction histidine kinase